MYIFGWIANVLVFIYKLPQMYTLLTVRDTTGLSLYSFMIQAVSYILYITHGVYTNDEALSYGMVPALIQNLIIICMYLYFRDKTQTLQLPIDVQTQTNHVKSSEVSV